MAKTQTQWNKGKGATYAWLVEHVNYQGDDCLAWPFSKLPRGYGILGHMGKRGYAHRMICELAHGPAPSDKHHAAHSCGNGHLSCVNPRHLSWKTPAENWQDAWKHGTQARSYHGNKGRLGPVADEIRALKGKETQTAVARKYGASLSSIANIWNNVTFRIPHS